MSRVHTSALLERVYKTGDVQAALALLEQSMALGHRRIALIRYLQAQHLQAPLDARHHEYVRAIAARMSAVSLARVVGEARARAARGSHEAASDRQAGQTAAPAQDPRR